MPWVHSNKYPRSQECFKIALQSLPYTLPRLVLHENSIIWPDRKKQRLKEAEHASHARHDWTSVPEQLIQETHSICCCLAFNGDLPSAAVRRTRRWGPPGTAPAEGPTCQPPPCTCTTSRALHPFLRSGMLSPPPTACAVHMYSSNKTSSLTKALCGCTRSCLSQVLA